MTSHTGAHPNAALLESATKGFGHLFANDIIAAKEHFSGNEDPFHLMGLGVCAFLEAVLGMEADIMTEASRCLALSETASRKWSKNAASSAKSKAYSRFPAGIEWEILNADAVVLLGMTNALSESYMGYLQCMYSLNSAHSKFTKLYKTVFPAGLPEIETTPKRKSETETDGIANDSLSPPTNLKHKTSFASISSTNSGLSAASAATPPATSPGTPTGSLTPTSTVGKGFFSRWMGASNGAAAASEPSLLLHGHGHQGHVHEQRGYEDGVVEELIVSGTAFGYGLFNLVFSLLPKKVQGLVGFLGFQHDRRLALKALALSASKNDVHGVFSGLVLMTYYGVVLLLSGWQADEEQILRQYRGIVDNVESRYPAGALWILNRAKILRMGYDPEGAIRVLKDGLGPERTHTFAQADMMLWFELSWTFLGQRRYEEAAEAFIKLTELNSWSHGTYYFIAAGCYFSIGNKEKAQQLLDAVPALLDLKKVGGKELPTEVFIKKKLVFYKEKQARRGGDPAKFVEAIKISPAEELSIFWNTHARIDAAIAKAHIAEYAALTPRLSISSPEIEELVPDAVLPTTPSASLKSRRSTITARTPTTPVHSPSSPQDDLDNAEELAVRSLLLGVCHKTVNSYAAAKAFLEDAVGYQEAGRIKVNTWVAGLAVFELGVAEIREVEWLQTQAQMKRRTRTPQGERRRSRTRDGEEEEDGASTPTSRFGDEDEDVGGDHGDDEVYWKGEWAKVLKSASVKLERALGFSGSTVDLSSRLDSRVSMLRDEIAMKREMLGIVGV